MFGYISVNIFDANCVNVNMLSVRFSILRPFEGLIMVFMKRSSFGKSEHGFSLVELAVAAGLAVALGAATVFVLNGSADVIKSEATRAADEATAYNRDVLNLYDGRYDFLLND